MRKAAEHFTFATKAAAHDLGDVFKLEGNRRERWMYERGDDTEYIE